MGNLTPGEQAMVDIMPTWGALDAITAQRAAMMQFCREEIPQQMRGTLAEFAEAARLLREFDEFWPHRVPTGQELVLADRAGRLGEKIKELNEAFARGE